MGKFTQEGDLTAIIKKEVFVIISSTYKYLVFASESNFFGQILSKSQGTISSRNNSHLRKEAKGKKRKTKKLIRQV